MLILGLVLLIGAGVVGTMAVLGNRGASHQLTAGFHVFGRTMHGSSGQLFFWGAVVGAVAMLGLALLFAGLRGDVRRRGQARHDSAQLKQHTVQTDSDVTNDSADDARTTPRRTRKREPQPVSVDSGDGADGDAGAHP